MWGTEPWGRIESRHSHIRPPNALPPGSSDIGIPPRPVSRHDLSTTSGTPPRFFYSESYRPSGYRPSVGNSCSASDCEHMPSSGEGAASGLPGWAIGSPQIVEQNVPPPSWAHPASAPSASPPSWPRGKWGWMSDLPLWRAPGVDSAALACLTGYAVPLSRSAGRCRVRPTWQH